MKGCTDSPQDEENLNRSPPGGWRHKEAPPATSQGQERWQRQGGFLMCFGLSDMLLQVWKGSIIAFICSALTCWHALCNFSHLILKAMNFQIHWTPHWSEDPTRDCCTLTAVDVRIGLGCPTRGTPLDFYGANARATCEPGELMQRMGGSTERRPKTPPVRSGSAGIAHLWSGTWNIMNIPNCNAWPRPPWE